MITNFEEITSELTPKEEELANLIADLFNKDTTIGWFVKNQELIDYLVTQGIRPRDLHGARIRKLINYIRLKKMVKNLIATSRGYKVSQDQEEIDKYVKSLQERINSIIAVKNSFSSLNV